MTVTSTSETEPDLTIPPFLIRECEKKRLTSPDTTWYTPVKKENRNDRRHKKFDRDKMVVTVVNSGADTFHKIRKELGDGWETKDISNALRRCAKLRRITKVARRYFPYRDR